MGAGSDRSPKRNQRLIEDGGISFESVVTSTEQVGLLDVREQPNLNRCPRQMIYAFETAESIDLVPIVRQADGTRLLKTIAPTRKAARASRGAANMTDEISAEGRAILVRFERGDLPSGAGIEREVEVDRQAARNTFNMTKRVDLRLTEHDFGLALSRSREEGMPYQTLLSGVIHKDLSGRLIEKR